MSVINEFMYNVLVGINSVIGNYGVSIILFTFLIRLVCMPFDYRSRKGMRKMSAIQPKLNELQRKYADELHAQQRTTDEDRRLWRETLYEIALQQLMASPDVAARSKQIFLRTAIKGEKPEAVADAFSVSRDVVDQTKKRMLDRLRALVDSLKDADED